MKKLKPLKRKLKKLCSDLTYKREKGICMWCKKKIQSRRGAHAHHIFAKSLSNPYGHYNLDNLVLLCYRCHIFRLKSEIFEYTKWLESYLTEHDLTYPKLREMYRKPVKLTYEDYEYLFQKLKEKE